MLLILPCSFGLYFGASSVFPFPSQVAGLHIGLVDILAQLLIGTQDVVVIFNFIAMKGLVFI